MDVRLSPGVYLNEKSFQSLVASASETTVAVIGAAAKGPEEPVLVTSQQQLLSKFGNPLIDDPAVYSALVVLSQCSRLYFRRVVGVAGAAAKGTATTGGWVFEATSKGTWSNGYEVVITPVGEASDNTYSIAVKKGTEVLETYMVSPDETKANYILTVINQAEDAIISVTAGTTNQLAAETITLSGGVDGNTNITADEYNAAVDDFADVDTTQIDIMLLPGVTGTALQSAQQHAQTVCENRGDCIVVLDIPVALSVDDAINYVNAVDDTGSVKRFNSSYSVFYWPHCKVADTYNKVTRLIPPSAFAVAQYIYTDKNFNVWNAPAGLKRGVIQGIVGLEYQPTQEDRDKLLGNTNVINPFVIYRGQGPVIFGNRTTLRDNSSDLTRVNVRRMVCWVKRAVAMSSAYLLFDQNDEYLWNEWKNLIDPILRPIKATRGLKDYRLICDASVNTPEVIKARTMKAKIELVPIAAVDVINLEFMVTDEITTVTE